MVELDKLRLNIPQLKTVVSNTIGEYNDFLSKEIRVIGLREKIERRVETLEKIQGVLSKHKE